MYPKHTNDKEYLKKKVVSKNIYFNKQAKHEQKLRKQGLFAQKLCKLF